MSKTGQALPSTGVDQSIATFVAGLGLLGLSGYLFFRHKKTRKYLIVFLAASGAGLTVFSAQAAVRALGDVVTDTTTIGATYTYSPAQTIGDYHYVGYIVEQKAAPTIPTTPTTPPAKETGSVIVHYVDANGNTLQTDYVDSRDVPVGTSYNTADNTTEKPDELDVASGFYMLDRVEGTELGTVTKGTTEVTYVYAEAGKVIVRYFDAFGNKIADDNTAVKQKVGTSYDVSSLGYNMYYDPQNNGVQAGFYSLVDISEPISASDRQWLEDYNSRIIDPVNKLIIDNIVKIKGSDGSVDPNKVFNHGYRTLPLFVDKTTGEIVSGIGISQYPVTFTLMFYEARLGKIVGNASGVLSSGVTYVDYYYGAVVDIVLEL
ncbi:MucBP domain-containing protein [Streptococcus suis]|nr:MucBP domain-containing protein [Streptococcus suis]